MALRLEARVSSKCSWVLPNCLTDLIGAFLILKTGFSFPIPNGAN